MIKKVAVVTGSNKGIGYGIVKKLCQRGVTTVYLTSRDVKKGLQAIQELNKDGHFPQFHQLDTTDKESVKNFADDLKNRHGGIDILINNAGIITNDSFKTTYEDAKRVIDVNYKTQFIIQEYLFPILNENARVINISSDCGHISNLRNKYWIDRLTKEDLKREDVDDFVNWFLNSVKNDTLNENDFQEMELLAYRISKIALSALTRVQQKEVDHNISINPLHPGFVKTDMTTKVGDLTIEEASVAPVYLALDIDQSVKGGYFWFDKTEKNWADPNLDLYCHFENTIIALKEMQSSTQ